MCWNFLDILANIDAIHTRSPSSQHLFENIFAMTFRRGIFVVKRLEFHAILYWRGHGNKGTQGN